MDRRSFLVGAVAAAAAFLGWTRRDELEDVLDDIFAAPQTDAAIKNLGGDSFLKRMVLYESGAALMEFGDDYGCYERIAVGDTATLRNNNLGVWQLPRDGELVVDLKSAVSNTRDPSNTFYLDSLGGRDQYCFSGRGITKKFTVPQDWIE